VQREVHDVPVRDGQDVGDRAPLLSAVRRRAVRQVRLDGTVGRRSTPVNPIRNLGGFPPSVAATVRLAGASLHENADAPGRVRDDAEVQPVVRREAVRVLQWSRVRSICVMEVLPTRLDEVSQSLVRRFPPATGAYASTHAAAREILASARVTDKCRLPPWWFSCTVRST